MKFFSILFSGAALLISSNLYADQLCEGKAKYGAVRAYIGHTGVVQGSEGPKTTSRLVDGPRDGRATYLVEVIDSNEDGEAWSAFYLVKAGLDAKESCAVLSVKRVGTVSH